MPEQPPAFEPPSFEFAPTIVSAGSRTATVELVNPGLSDVTVLDVSIDPTTVAASSFSVESTTCLDGLLAPGARCTVEVRFAPTEVGALSAAVLASFGDGTTARVELNGLAADSPVLTVTPDVASNGQVVAVLGAGFPAGAIVELVWDDGRSIADVEISEIGDLTHTMIVLPHTPRGPRGITAVGQTDLFGDVTVDVLVSDHATRMNTAVFGGVGRPVRS